MRATIVFLSALWGFGLADSSVPVPWTLPFNNSIGFGPDGPWNFLTMSVGNAPVDFYPAWGPGSNFLMRRETCDAQAASCISPTPNNYVTATENSTSLQSLQYNPDLTPNLTQFSGNVIWEWRSDWNVPFPVKNVQSLISNDTVSNLPTRQTSRHSYVPLSILGMNDEAAHPSIAGPSGTTLLANYVAASKSSYSTGLTMGSVAFDQNATLLFSGYDQSRVIEDPAVFTAVGAVQVKSLSFGVDSGASPWTHAKNLPSNFANGQWGGQADGIKPYITPQAPYLYLPSAMCDAMASFLPVIPDPETNLYLWNTSDPAYRDIVSSPSYLNFTFAGITQASIRVPFALLNLTLDQPLKDKPTPYFPCYGRDLAPMPISLGRAFLQAAYVMTSFQPHQIVSVAQAPGPKVPLSMANPIPKAVSAGSPAISAMPNAPRWADTWAGILTPLQDAPASPNGGGNNTSSTGTDADASRLTPAAIAGIAIGASAAVGLLITVPIVIFLLRRRGGLGGGRGRPSDAMSLHSQVSELPPPSYGSSHADGAPVYKGWEKSDGSLATVRWAAAGVEMEGSGQTELLEIDGRQMRAEIPSDGRQRAAELDQDHGTSWKRFSSEAASRQSTRSEQSGRRGESIGGSGESPARHGGVSRGLRQIMSDDWERYGNVLDAR